jgi:hypothetical protein
MFLQVIVIDKYALTFFFNSGDFVLGKKVSVFSCCKNAECKIILCNLFNGITTILAVSICDIHPFNCQRFNRNAVQVGTKCPTFVANKT